jgi:hypothetical protein
MNSWLGFCITLTQREEQSEAAFREASPEKGAPNGILLVIISALRLPGHKLALKKDDHCWTFGLLRPL